MPREVAAIGRPSCAASRRDRERPAVIAESSPQVDLEEATRFDHRLSFHWIDRFLGCGEVVSDSVDDRKHNEVEYSMDTAACPASPLL
jgi:hypothetical protein